MSHDTLYPPPPETDTENDPLPLQIQQNFDTMYEIIKDKRGRNHPESPTDSIMEGRISTKRSRERLDLLLADSIVEEKKYDEGEERGLKASSSTESTSSNHLKQDQQMTYFEAAVTAAVLIDQEITRWERGVAELESLFAESCHESEGSVVDVPFPFLLPVVESTSSESVVE